MNNKKVSIYVAGGFTVTVTVLLMVMLGLIIAGEIHPRQIPITITTADAEKFYDGEILRAEKYSIKYGEIDPDHTLRVEFTAEPERVGSVHNDITVHVTDKKGNDVTDLYAFEIRPGTLKIKTRSITLSTGSAGKIYDGTPLTNSTCDIVGGSLVDGHKLDVRFTGVQNLRGSSSNTASARVLDKNGDDISECYEIAYEPGTLTVTPRDIAIASADAEKVFDGSPLKASGWSIISGSTCAGHSIQVTVGGSQTEVGESENEIISVVIYYMENGAQVDVTQGYRIKLYPGTLYVSP